MDTDRYDSRKVVENQYFFLIWLPEIPSDFESVFATGLHRNIPSSQKYPVYNAKSTTAPLLLKHSAPNPTMELGEKTGEKNSQKAKCTNRKSVDTQ